MINYRKESNEQRIIGIKVFNRKSKSYDETKNAENYKDIFVFYTNLKRIRQQNQMKKKIGWKWKWEGWRAWKMKEKENKRKQNKNQRLTLFVEL